MYLCGLQISNFNNMIKKLFILPIMMAVLIACTNGSNTSLTQREIDSIENAKVIDDVFNDGIEGETEDVAGVSLNVMFKNSATENLSTPSKLTLEQFKAVCKAKPGKDLYFFVDGKTTLADCYAHIIGGYMEYDGNAVK